MRLAVTAMLRVYYCGSTLYHYLMIAYLSGKILTKQATTVIIDVGGVGYEVNIPLSTFYDLGEAGAPIQLTIHTHVREDALQLFGFKTLRERDIFLRLLSVSGVGPKLALTMLSGLSADELVNAIRHGDLVRLTRLPGVGKKIAERIILELREKIAALASLEMELGTTQTASATATKAPQSVREDVLSALVNLGYQKVAAEKAFKTALAEHGEASVQVMIRRSLQQLARG